MLLRTQSRRRDRRRSGFSALAYAPFAAGMLVVSLAAAPGDLRGVLVDETGAEMWGAHIVIRDDLAGRSSDAKSEVRTLTTARTGKFAARLQPGFYDVCVMADGFQAVCKKVKIVDGKPTEVRFIFKPDPDVFNAIGDRIGR